MDEDASSSPESLKARLIHLGLSRQRRDEASDQLQVGRDIAFQLRADDAGFGQHIGACVLPVDEIVLIFREQPEQDDHRQKNACKRERKKLKSQNQ